MKNRKFKAIIFDVDGVLIKSLDEKGNFLWEKGIKDDIGIHQEHLAMIFSSEWEDIIRGKIKLTSYLQRIFKEELFQNVKVPIQYYISYWLQNDFNINPDMIELVKSLKSPCYLATNQEALRLNYIKRHIGRYFRGCFASCNIGYTKREPQFFNYIEQKLCLLGEELLLIDDTKANVDCATNCGWGTFWYNNNFKELRTFLPLIDSTDHTEK